MPRLPRGLRVRKHLGYVRRYPGVMPRAALNYAQLLALRRPMLRGVELAVTYRCNCACEHCSAAGLRAAGGAEPSAAQVLDAVRQCRRMGALNINLTGGEALLRPDLEDIVRGSGPRSAVISLATNGLLLSAERAASLARAGLSIVTISLAAAEAAEHDRRRGHPGCFEAALAAGEHARAAGLEVFFCTILMKHHLLDGQADRLVAMTRERGATLTVNMPWAVGGCGFEGRARGQALGTVAEFALLFHGLQPIWLGNLISRRHKRSICSPFAAATTIRRRVSVR